jgi:hypothetical protein
MKMQFYKRHTGIIEVDNWAGRLRFDPNSSLVDRRNQDADHLEESRVECLKLTLAQHIKVLRGWQRRCSKKNFQEGSRIGR